METGYSLIQMALYHALYILFFEGPFYYCPAFYIYSCLSDEYEYRTLTELCGGGGNTKVLG
jgi:hypothetical protein